MTRKIFVSALVAGAVAAVVAAVLQFALVIPLLMEGELYETGARVHFGPNGAESPAGAPALGGDITRHGLSVAFNLVTWIGLGLVTVALMALGARRGMRIDAGTGAIWGLAGFAVFSLLPAAGLPPELPGTVAADTFARQLWWGATVVAAVIGVLAIAFRPGLPAMMPAAILLLAPHVAGAPQLETYLGVSPPELSALFATRVLAVSAAAWVVLGAVAGWLWSRA